MSTKLTTISDIVKSGLCSGCGACAGLAPDVLEMFDVVHEGRRPATLPNVRGRSDGNACCGVSGLSLSTITIRHSRD